MKLEIIKANKSILLKDIEELESKFDFKFPKDYKDFLLEFNGGETSLMSFFDFHGNEYDLLFFNSLEEIKYFIEFYFDLIPEDMFPIGVIDGNSWVFISIKKSNNGIIFLGDSNTCRGIEESELNFIANSFTDFINAFKLKD